MNSSRRNQTVSNLLGGSVNLVPKPKKEPLPVERLTGSVGEKMERLLILLRMQSYIEEQINGLREQLVPFCLERFAERFVENDQPVNVTYQTVLGAVTNIVSSNIQLNKEKVEQLKNLKVKLPTTTNKLSVDMTEATKANKLREIENFLHSLDKDVEKVVTPSIRLADGTFENLTKIINTDLLQEVLRILKPPVMFKDVEVKVGKNEIIKQSQKLVRQ